MSVTVTLPDGKALQLTDGATGADAAAAIGPGLARAALAVEVSHPDSGQSAEVRDLTRALPNDASIAIITDKSGDSALELIRHDAAHVLAAAVMELYPGVKISIGPPIAEGFYYDFEFPSKSAVSEADFPAIEERMREHIKGGGIRTPGRLPPAGARTLPGGETGLQGRADRRPRIGGIGGPATRAAADGVAVYQWTLHRSLPRPACANHLHGEGVQAALHGRRLLAR